MLYIQYIQKVGLNVGQPVFFRRKKKILWLPLLKKMIIDYFSTFKSFQLQKELITN